MRKHKRPGRQQCRKLTYPSEGYARNAAARIERVKEDQKHLRPYLCDYCHEWHLSSQPLGERRQAAERHKYALSRADVA